MKLLSALSIRALLLLLAAMFVLPAALIIFLSGERSQEEKIQEARVETQKLAGAIAAAYEARLAAARQLMTALAKLPEVKAQDPGVQHLLADIVALNPDYTNISIADTSGHVWASATSGSFNIADRRHFRGALASGQLSSGEYVTARSTPKPTLFFGYPFRDAQGAISGVINVGFDLSQIRFVDLTRLPPGSSFSLSDHAGVVLARAIDSKPWVGKPIDPALLAAMAKGPDEATNVGPSLTGERRVQTYRRLWLPGEKTPYLFIRAGMPYSEVIAGANRALARNIALLLSFFLAAVVLALVVAKRTIVDRIARLESASQQLAGGDLSVRVGPLVEGGELGQLARSFDRMAEQLSRREEALRETERNLLQAQKMETVGRLAGGVAHDFNNQLTAILNSAEHLVEVLRGNDAEVARSVREAALRSSRLVKQLLSFARKEPARVVPVDLHRTIEEVVALLSRSIDKRIQLRTELGAVPSRVVGDPDRLHTVLVNLALNGRDAMPEGGTITFATTRVELDAVACAALPFDLAPGPHVQVRVTDTGVGLSEDARAHLFEPFFTTKGSGGSGLGLAEVYGTVQVHRGAITVESTPGAGTTVTLLLPAAAAAVAERPAEPAGVERAAPSRPLRVLVADDERGVLDSLSLLLRKGGHEVIACDQGGLAVRTHNAGADRIDVVILDMMMPDLSGKEVLAQIRESTPGVPVIISTGFSARADLDELRREPAVYFLAKPYTAEQLERTLARACAEG